MTKFNELYNSIINEKDNSVFPKREQERIAVAEAFEKYVNNGDLKKDFPENPPSNEWFLNINEWSNKHIFDDTLTKWINLAVKAKIKDGLKKYNKKLKIREIKYMTHQLKLFLISGHIDDIKRGKKIDLGGFVRRALSYEDFNIWKDMQINEGHAARTSLTYKEVESLYKNVEGHAGNTLSKAINSFAETIEPNATFDKLLMDSFEELGVLPEYRDQLIENGYYYLADFLDRNNLWRITYDD